MRQPGALVAVRDVLRQVFSIVEKPLHSLAETGKFFDCLAVEIFNGEQRDDADNRAHAKRRRLAVAQKLIVIKTILFIPKSEAAETIHRINNLNEMLEKFRCDIFVS